MVITPGLNVWNLVTLSLYKIEKYVVFTIIFHNSSLCQVNIKLNFFIMRLWEGFLRHGHKCKNNHPLINSTQDFPSFLCFLGCMNMLLFTISLSDAGRCLNLKQIWIQFNARNTGHINLWIQSNKGLIYNKLVNEVLIYPRHSELERLWLWQDHDFCETMLFWSNEPGHQINSQSLNQIIKITFIL